MLLKVQLRSLRRHVEDDAFDLMVDHGIGDPLRNEEGRFEVDVELHEEQDGIMTICIWREKSGQRSSVSNRLPASG